ncbi:MAG: hypothetical protein GY793_06595 [Proteobacteria bacterium]|nr:hypothetical protein [Pseudomonadota bacterium]
MKKLGKVISNTEYHSMSDMNASSLKVYAEMPAKYKFQLTQPKQPPTEAMIIGSATHTHVLEPEKFNEEVVVFKKAERPEPEKTFVSKLNKQWKLDLYETAESENKIVIDEETFNQIDAMKESVWTEHGEVSMLLNKENKEVESSFFAEVCGVKCRVRPDLLIPDDKIILDLKTLEDARLNKFQSHMLKFGYDIQAGLYTLVLKAVTGIDFSFNFLCVEKKAPHFTTIFTLDKDDEFYKHCQSKVKMLLERYKGSMKYNNWPAHESIQPLPLPAYITSLAGGE